MSQRNGGTKRSSWLTFRRRLLLVRLLLRGPHTAAALIAAIQSELGDQGYPEAAASALKHDFDALKREFGCAIRFDRAAGRYTLDDLGELALLDLTDASLEALAFLEASFPTDAALPEQAHVGELLGQIVALLPPHRRDQQLRRRATVRMEPAGQSPARIDRATLVVIKRAVRARQELVFDYLSTFDESTPRTHRVAPYEVFFRLEGHGYLDATLLEAIPSRGEVRHSAIHYRLDRIVPGSARVLPAMLPPQRPAPPTYQLRYRLLPVVARRRDIATYFPETQITYHDDGSATVTATVTNLWQTRQVLLRYGTACHVLAPPKLVALFRQTAIELAALYRVDDPLAERPAHPGEDGEDR